MSSDPPGGWGWPSTPTYRYGQPGRKLPKRLVRPIFDNAQAKDRDSLRRFEPGRMSEHQEQAQDDTSRPPIANPLVNGTPVLSGWADLNRRPPAPKAGALPDCATSRVT